jgi:hypothetical protein
MNALEMSKLYFKLEDRQNVLKQVFDKADPAHKNVLNEIMRENDEKKDKVEKKLTEIEVK